MTISSAREERASLAHADDADLVRLGLRGSHEAFTAIMRRYNQRLFRVARGILKDDAEAEDALQEAYLRAYLKLASFEGRSSLSTWLSRLVVNEALGRLRRGKGRALLGETGESHAGAASAEVIAFSQRADGGPDKDFAREELRALLEAAIDDLPDAFRPVFMMREIEGMSIKEIADVLDVPEATVKTRCFRARKTLQRELRKRLEDPLGETFAFLGRRCDGLVARVLERLRAMDGMKT